MFPTVYSNIKTQHPYNMDTHTLDASAHEGKSNNDSQREETTCLNMVLNPLSNICSLINPSLRNSGYDSGSHLGDFHSFLCTV